MAELKALQALAKEMNETMGLNPKIKFTAVKADDLLVDIINNACGIDPKTGEVDEANVITEGDTFTNAAWATLAEILDPEVDEQAGVANIAAAKVEASAEAAAAKKPAKTGKEKTPAPAKVEAAAPAKVKKEKTPVGDKKSFEKALWSRLEVLAKTNKHTRKEINALLIAGLSEEFGDVTDSQKKAINNALSNCKNDKYSKLPSGKLVAVTDGKYCL